MFVLRQTIFSDNLGKIRLLEYIWVWKLCECVVLGRFYFFSVVAYLTPKMRSDYARCVALDRSAPVMLKHFWVISDSLTSSCISKILLQPTCFSCQCFPSDDHPMTISTCPCWRSQLLKAGTIKHVEIDSPATLMMIPQQGGKHYTITHR